MKDVVVVVALVLSFTTLTTAHLALAYRLARRTRPAWHGLMALVVPPLAVIWGYKAGFWRNATLWIGALVGYVVARIAAIG